MELVLYRGMNLEEYNSFIKGEFKNPVSWWSNELLTSQLFSRGVILKIKIKLDKKDEISYITSEKVKRKGFILNYNTFGVKHFKEENKKFYSICNKYLKANLISFSKVDNLIPENDFSIESKLKNLDPITIIHIMNKESVEIYYEKLDIEKIHKYRELNANFTITGDNFLHIFFNNKI